MSDTAEPTRPRWAALALHATGIAIVAAHIVGASTSGTMPWQDTTAGVVALVGWAVFVGAPARLRPATTVGLVLALVGGALAGATVLPIIPALVAVLAATADLRRPLWFGLGLATLGAALVVAAAPITPHDTLDDALGSLLALVIAALAGFSRRQVRQRAMQAAQLDRRDRQLQREHAHAEVLATRQSVARDIHDVLAHSLGGLAVQLNAIDALLEAGRTDDARSRMRAARDLASEGLREARRAVDALRDPGDAGGPGDATADAAGVAVSPVAAVDAELQALIATHRDLGGVVGFTRVGTPPPAVPARLALALRRALQEALSNARGHAPGQPVDVTVEWSGDTVVLRVDNPVTAGGVPDEVAGGVPGVAGGVPGGAGLAGGVPGGAGGVPGVTGGGVLGVAGGGVPGGAGLGGGVLGVAGGGVPGGAGLGGGVPGAGGGGAGQAGGVPDVTGSMPDPVGAVSGVAGSGSVPGAVGAAPGLARGDVGQAGDVSDVAGLLGGVPDRVGGVSDVAGGVGQAGGVPGVTGGVSGVAGLPGGVPGAAGAAPGVAHGGAGQAGGVPGVTGGVPATLGGRRGLQGMRERFAQLPGGEVTASIDRGVFVLRVRAGVS